MMRIAVLLEDIQLSQIREGVLYAFLFDVDRQIITAVGKELIKISDINYICLWLLGKHVTTVYYNHFSDAEKKLLERVDIHTKPFDDIRSNPILEAMLVYP